MKQHFGQKLLDWYDLNKRDLPWRDVRDPYRIWLSEIILQQTRVEQGKAYYQRFLETFPDVMALAQAPARKVFKLWQGLGYYNRAANLMKTAGIIAKQYGGKFPETFDLLKKLPGIGDYTAAAIASFAFDQPCPVTDGNVYRVLSRIFGIETPVHSAAGKKEFTALARKLMANHPPAQFNQALMEFGALNCTPQSPGCSTCIFNTQCYAARSGKQKHFPVKKPKAPMGKRFFYFFVMQLEQNGESYFYLRKRTGQDIWRNLYDFPALETGKSLADPLESLSNAGTNLFPETFPYTPGIPSAVYRQQLTHLKVSAVFIPVFLKIPLPDETKKNVSLVHINQLSHYPVPRLIARYLQDQNIVK